MSRLATRQRVEAPKGRPGWYIIEVQLAKDGEPRDLFFGGADEGDFVVRRGEQMAVPESIVERLRLAVAGVSEVDPEDPEKTITVMRQRFAFSVLGKVQ
ncbi:MAG: hypothetical protein RIQ53_2624 [Pseudomonadota bacterium]|jgi:hypothetical protein